MAARMPRAIQMDASSHCQLACPVCPTATGLTLPVLGAGHLKVADFERLLSDNPEIREVELSNYGEMFLNPQLPDLLACAYERQVVVSGSNGVNLNFASEAALNAVVKYRVRPHLFDRWGDAGNLLTVPGQRPPGPRSATCGPNPGVATARPIRISAARLAIVAAGHNEHEIELARAMAQAQGHVACQALVERRAFANRQSGTGTDRDRARSRDTRGIPEKPRRILHAQPLFSALARARDQLGRQNAWLLRQLLGRLRKQRFHRRPCRKPAASEDEICAANAAGQGGRVEPCAGIPCTDCDQFKEMAGSQKMVQRRGTVVADMTDGWPCPYRFQDANLRGYRSTVSWRVPVSSVPDGCSGSVSIQRCTFGRRFPERIRPLCRA